MAMMECSRKSEDAVVVVCPTEEELQAEPLVNVPCLVEGCNKTFNTTAARSIHLIQTHKIYKDEDEKARFSRSLQKSIPKVVKHFYCPVQVCNRSRQWNKPFSRLSLLKQHYYILHAEKKYQCDKCEKRFSIMSQKTSHERDCGKEFFCTCGEKHKSITALYMHAKRKQHELPEQYNKRKKSEPPREMFILVVPVPCGNPQQVQRTMLQPVPLLPHPLASNLLPLSGASSSMSGGVPRNALIPATATKPGGVATVSAGSTLKRDCHPSATTSTQTDESGVPPVPLKLSTSSSYAQTAHSCFPSFIPMMNGPRRHKKTLAVQTFGSWIPGQLPSKMASSETQTLDGQGVTGQGQQDLSLPGTQPAIHSHRSPMDQALSGPFFRPLSSLASINGPQESPPIALVMSASSSTVYHDKPKDSEATLSSRSIPSDSQLDTNSTQTPWNVVTVNNNPTDVAATSTADPRNNAVSPNEVRTQTDLTFQSFMEHSSSETQTQPSLNDAMTDTNEQSFERVTDRNTVRPAFRQLIETNTSCDSTNTNNSSAEVLSIQTDTRDLTTSLFSNVVQTTLTSTNHIANTIPTNTSTSSETATICIPTSLANTTPAPVGLHSQTRSTGIPLSPLPCGTQSNNLSFEQTAIGIQTDILFKSPASVQIKSARMPQSGIAFQNSGTSMSPRPYGPGVQTYGSNISARPIGHSVQTSISSNSTSQLGVQNTGTAMSPAPLNASLQSSGTSISPAPFGLDVQSTSTSMSSAPFGHGGQTSSTSLSPPHMRLDVQTIGTSMSSAPFGLDVQTSGASVSTTPFGSQTIGTSITPTSFASISPAPSQHSVQTSVMDMSPSPIGLGVQTSRTVMSPAPFGLGIQSSCTSMSPTNLQHSVQTRGTDMSPAPFGLGVQTSCAGSSPAPLSLNVQTSCANVSPTPLALGSQTRIIISPKPLDIANQNTSISSTRVSEGFAGRPADPIAPSEPDIMSGLDLLFLASTEHRANADLTMPPIDESLCCQETQTVFDTDTGHQETQTAWDWSLDEFSFLDQYTQTAMSTNISTSSTTTMPETDQFCQTGLDLFPQFAFSNTETQTVSVFDLDMFGNSISVQTEAGAKTHGDGESTKEVQVPPAESPQEKVSADVQTEETDFNRHHSRQMGGSQLASSHTQTSLWEDIESIIRSDSFTQTQLP